jgi:hypothetical protein
MTGVDEQAWPARTAGLFRVQDLFKVVRHLLDFVSQLQVDDNVLLRNGLSLLVGRRLRLPLACEVNR